MKYFDKKTGIVLLFLFYCKISLSVVINVSSIYMDGPTSYNQATLEGTHERLKTYFNFSGSGPWEVTENVEVKIFDNVKVASSGITKLTWKIGGNSTFKVKIFSATSGYPEIQRSNSDVLKNGYVLEIFQANHVYLTNLTFPEAINGVLINSSDDCRIEYCKFYGNIIEGGGGSGAIVITRSPEDGSIDLPRFNIISNNYIQMSGASTVTGLHEGIPAYRYYHGIYLGQSLSTEITYNTIINPPGYGVHYYHGYAQFNTVKYNLIDMCNDADPDEKGGLLLGFGDCGTPGCTESSVSGNINDYNYIVYSEKVENQIGSGYFSPNDTRDLLVNENLDNTNPEFNNNYFSHADFQNNGRYAIDPYWVYYNSNLVTNRMVSGDFDGDSDFDDIASIYSYGSSNSQIHLWLNKRDINGDDDNPEQDKSFQYLGNVWSSSGFDANKVTGRVVSGDFNDDGKTDIASLYDLGGSTSRIYVWLSNGSGFAPASSWWYSGTGAFTASKVTGRMVAGDFNNDGKDDVAAMYDDGNSNSRIFVWTSNGTGTLTPSTYWTSNPNSYNATKVSYRFVSGDFNADGKSDIAAMYDYGSSTSAIHAWISNGSAFSPSGYAYTFWSSTGGNYNALKVSNRFVSGDFNNDGKTDITAYYDYGGDNTSAHTWISNGSSFLSPQTRWVSNTNAYDPLKLNGRLVAGDFDNDGFSDVCGMYDYSANTSFYRTRFHVWETSGSTLQIQNNSLGYPWMKLASDIGMICNNQRNFSTDYPTHFDSLEDSTNKNIEQSKLPEMTFNTFENVIVFASTDESVSVIKIYDLSGRILCQTDPFQYASTVDVNYLPVGVYILSIVSDGEIYSLKFTKQ